MTNEAPKGLKNNLMNSFTVSPIGEPEFFNGNSMPVKFKKLLFGLLFFHAVIQERRLYGPLGWTNRYEFNEPDLRISAQQLSIFINEYPDKTPFDAIHYCIGECNYGGRVTDGKDRVTLMCLLQTYICDKTLVDGYKFSPSGTYYSPEITATSDYEEYFEYCRSLPKFPEPEVFGMHANAAITKEINETNDTLGAILSTMQAGGGGASGDAEAVIMALADSIIADVPAEFDIRQAEKDYPVDYNQSMNTVLTQELARFNLLIKTIKASLKDMKRAIVGEILMSNDLEDAMVSMTDGQIPAMWLSKSFPSLKPLGSYIKDLKERLEFFNEWVAGGVPDCLWINKFFFTHGFLTGAMQNYARKYSIAIDTLGYDFKVVHDVPDDGKGVPAPEDGIHVVGMYIEGCKWDPKERVLGESDPKILYTRCPMIHFMPTLKNDIVTTGIYACPLFKTGDRKGVLMTTGHSTNYVLDISLPSAVVSSHWIKRGVAMLCALMT